MPVLIREIPAQSRSVAEVAMDNRFGIGVDVTYMPAHFTVDVGTLLTQRLLEPLINKGIDANWVLSGQWRF